VTALGIVYLVGAGPGDPGLLTLRGAEVLRRADVVVHDRLTHPALVSMAPERAERLDVGKWPDQRGEQEKINRLLVGQAQAGKHVVRLKGGDPFVLGRGGEEALALIEAGVPFEVVPGVTSAVAVPAYAGVPVTHRGLATSFTVVAGHSRSVGRGYGTGGKGRGTNWGALAALGGTIVVLMGVANRGEIARRLMAGGLAPTTPVAVVRWGTCPEQVSLRTSLAGLEGTDVQPPATIVIGEVAGLDLRWYESRPLFGKTVVVTRAARQAGALTRRLSAAGARVLEVPALRLAPPADGGVSMVRAVEELRTYAWVVFTSENGVEKFFERVPDARSLGGARVAAVGPGTADTLRSYRVVADLVPVRHLAEGLLEEFPPPPAKGAGPRRLLLPQAAGARPLLRLGLAERGWEVDAVDAYQTLPESLDPRVLDEAKAADAICFASSSAVESYLDQSGPVPPVVACIGPVTARTARLRGLQVSAEAQEHTLDGLVSALVTALSGSRGRQT
jgi:uroporphyrinogen III methyltransferase/synthase